MKRTIAALCFTFVLALAANAADTAAPDAGAAKKPALTEEQKAAKKQLVEKYDANKDGKLDKEERGKFSAEDKAKWEELNPKKPAADKKEAVK